MNYVSEKENEKSKESKKGSEGGSFAEFENEAMEGNEESFGAEEVSLSEAEVPFYTGAADRSFSKPTSEPAVEEKDSCEERQRQELRERWRSVTGRRPRNIPNVKRYEDEVESYIPFGDRKPTDMDQMLRENWLLRARKVKTLVPNFGKVQREVRLPALCEGILSVRYSRYGESLATSYRNGGVQVRKPLTGQVTMSLETVEVKDRQAIRAVAFNPMNSEVLYTVGAYGIVQAFNVHSSESVHNSSYRMSQTNSLDVTPDGVNLITGGRQGKICILDTESLELKSMKEWPKLDETTQPNVEDEYHKMKIYALRCHPTNPNIYVTGSWDCTIKVWDVRMLPAVRSIRGPMVYGEGVDVMENRIVTASWRPENALSLWDLSSGKLIKNIPIVTKTTVFEGEFLYAVRFFSDSSNSNLVDSNCIAVGGSGFSSLLVINTHTQRTIAAFPNYKAIMSVDVTGNVVAYGGRESVLRIGDVTLTEPKQKSQARGREEREREKERD